MNTERIPKRKKGDKKKPIAVKENNSLIISTYICAEAKESTLYLFFRENSGTKGIECVSFLSGRT
jgi:hypothetical protein